MSNDAVIKEIGQKMLSGWRMLGSSCPICYTVLLQEKGDTKRYCCSCCAYLVTEAEAKEHNLTFSEEKEDLQSKKTSLPLTSQQETTKNSTQHTTTSSLQSSSTSQPSPQKTPQQPKGTALVDDDFENEENEKEMAFDSLHSSYDDLKSMYTKLMSGSSELIDKLSFSTPNMNENDVSIDEKGKDMSIDMLSSSLRKLLQGLNSYEDQSDEDDEIEYDPSGGLLASFLQETKPLPDQKKTKYTPQQTPPDPDQDWEYYNSRDTDIQHHNGVHIDPKQFELAQKEFSDKVLAGWVFSSHTCTTCQQILLFPPSITFTSDDVIADIISRFNLKHNPKSIPNNAGNVNTNLFDGDIDLDVCEYIRALCTHCGWCCIVDDVDTATGIEYVPTISHDCCTHSNHAEKVISSVTDASPKIPSTTFQTMSHQPQSKPAQNEWSSRIQTAMNKSITEQSKTKSKLPTNTTDKDYDFYNYNGLEETKKLLSSDDIQAKMAHLDDLSKLLSQALSQGKMILDEHCPDCIIPLVGHMIPQDMIDPKTGKYNTQSGMKLHHDSYAMMPKECVLCQQTWNIAPTNPQTTTLPPALPISPKPTFPPQTNVSKTLSPPTISPKPTQSTFSTQSHQSHQSHQISSNITFPQTQSLSQHQHISPLPQTSATKATLLRHLDVLCRKLATIDDQIETTTSLDALTQLLDVSSKLTTSIIDCQTSIDKLQ